MSERRLDLLLENLINEDYINGLKISMDKKGNYYLSIGIPRLTLSGIEYLENNSAMKQAYNVLKEIKGWIPGM
ncbi:MAG: YjcQ family protein [Fusobacteriaceae bacterium]